MSLSAIHSSGIMTFFIQKPDLMMISSFMQSLIFSGSLKN